MTTQTYVIVHIPANTPELPMSALGKHVTIRTTDDEPFIMPPLDSCPVTLNITGYTVGVAVSSPDYDDQAPCAGGCGELVPEPEAGDALCGDCLLATIPEDVRAMRPVLAHEIAALNDTAYRQFWSRLLHEYLADPPADHDIDALQDALQDFAQDRDQPLIRSLPSLAPAGPVAPPTRLAG